MTLKCIRNYLLENTDLISSLLFLAVAFYTNGYLFPTAIYLLGHIIYNYSCCRFFSRYALLISGTLLIIVGFLFTVHCLSLLHLNRFHLINLLATLLTFLLKMFSLLFYHKQTKTYNQHIHTKSSVNIALLLLALLGSHLLTLSGFVQVANLVPLTVCTLVIRLGFTFFYLTLT